MSSPFVCPYTCGESATSVAADGAVAVVAHTVTPGVALIRAQRRGAFALGKAARS